eukprot:g6459.t1
MKMGMASVIARGKSARLAVWSGKAKKTGGGLTKADQKRNKQGKVAACASVCTKKKLPQYKKEARAPVK